MPDPSHAEERQTTDKARLDLAARLAVRGIGKVEPNPPVGCVIARGDRVIGAGHHRVFGGPHAEREALADCARRGLSPAGATMYVTLEPCRHTGKQPPCTDAIIDAGIARVVYARADPGEQSGGGARVLREAGVEAVRTDTSENALSLTDPFVRTLRERRPWVIAKWAQTLDGRIATRTGESKWISGPRSRARVHTLRGRVDAILTGLGTVLADDPLLTARGPRAPRRTARRIVVDPDLDLPAGCRLVRTARQTPTLAACSKSLTTADIAADRRARLEAAGVEIIGVPERDDRPGSLRLDLLLAALHERSGVRTLMVESGAILLGAMLDADLVDEARVYIAPLVLGDEHALAAARGRVSDRLDQGTRMRLCHARRVDNDVELIYRRPPDDDRGTLSP